LHCDVFNGSGRAILHAPSRIKVVNYEIVQWHPDWFLEGTSDWSMVVLDEAHRIKNFTAKTSRVVRKITEKARYVYLLTGTPAPNGLEDWFGLLEAVKPGKFKDDFGLVIKTKTAFEARYCVKSKIGPEGQPGPYRITGYRNVAELHAAIASVTSHVTKAECLDLPEKVYETRKVALVGEQARVYRELKKQAITRLRSLKGEGTLTVNHVLTASLRLLQVVGGFVPDDAGRLHELPDKAKVEALADVLEEAGDRQVVVWCAFRPEVAFLDHWLNEHYGAVAVLTGETPAEERARAIQAFSAGQTRFFVGTAAAGGLGVNGLQERCDTEVFYSRDWNWATYTQAVDRLHRIGCKNAVSVTNLVASGTVDERVAEALERKAALQELLLRDPEEIL
jgi:SNF2 family DNA or RNA helicase